MNLIGGKEKDAARESLPEGLQRCKPLIDRLFTQSKASCWGISPSEFSAALSRSIKKSLASGVLAPDKLEAYLCALHVQDLALACACAHGSTQAWDYFVATYQNYLRAAAGAILRCPASSPNARELADSLFADLYGLSEGSRSDRSLFRYFHGRSSLKTWLRAVLAQRHVDAIRSARRFTDIEEDQQNSQPVSRAHVAAAIALPAQDPHRQRYLALFRNTLNVALGLLDHRDQNRLRLYYAENQTLAEIGRTLGEHESSVSRNLERARRELRRNVEQALRNGTATVNGSSEPGLSDAQIALCFEYAAEDAPIDFDNLFPAGDVSATTAKPASPRTVISPRKAQGSEP